MPLAGEAAAAALASARGADPRPDDRTGGSFVLLVSVAVTRTVERRAAGLPPGLAADFGAAGVRRGDGAAARLPVAAFAALVFGLATFAVPAFEGTAFLGTAFGVMDFLGMARPCALWSRKRISSSPNREGSEGYLGHVERKSRDPLEDMFELRSIDVDGGTLAVGLSGPAPSRARATVVAAHGITASLVSWNAVARALPDDIAIVAVDLRGRGASSSLPPPFGMRSHCADLRCVIDALSLDGVVAAWHSMGGYVASLLAVTHPTRVQSLVLIDGGFPLAMPPGLRPEQVVEAVVGPAVSRLSMTFASRDDYHDFWRVHPALAGPDAWNDDVVAYLDYDLEMTDLELTDLELTDLEIAGSAFRSRVSAEAVQADGLELLVDTAAGRAVEHVRCPIEIVRVERGLLDEPSPLVPLAIIDELVHGPHTVTTVADLNHYTVMFDPRGARAIAAAIVRAASAGGS